MKILDNQLIIEVSVEKGQTLSDIEQIYPLPTNGIFHKRLPGLGATHGEINSARHSIIVLPNQPVIQDKVAKHNKANPPEKEILGIYKGISKEDIQEYLSKDDVTHKKLLTTPEGYRDKIKPVLADIFDYVLKNYYLLIDECERTIQDVDYRHKITAPFDDLFYFTNKGLISATTLPFSDPRFDEFTHYVIVPKYDYQKQLTLIATNNIVTAFRDYVEKTQGDKYFIFVSSISAITALIDSVGIKDQSKIHCSERKVGSLKMRGFKADHMLDKDRLLKFNFLTSRFYSAVDIELDYKPDVLMITEVVFSEHSVLDPQTEVIQIVGRFRKGTTTITHISNFNPTLVPKTPEQVKTYLDGQQDVYKQILKLKDSMRTDGALDAIDQILTESRFAGYFKPDGSYNWFMLDNLIQEQRVLALYQNMPNLLDGYALVTDHFNVTVENKFYPLTDGDRLRRQSSQNRKEEIKEVVNELERVTPTLKNYNIFWLDPLNELNRDYRNIVEAYNTIGKNTIVELGYNERRIARALDRYKKGREFYKQEVVKAVHKKFKVGEFYPEMYIASTLQDIFDRNGVKCDAGASDIQKYFKAQRSSRKSTKHKGYNLLEAQKFDPIDDPTQHHRH
ncbi:MAG TPA: hypothetical protein VGN20_10345 [Mucilaginibacter sp.]|jgi:hypothetical protein